MRRKRRKSRRESTMRNEFLPFSRPSITEEDIAAVAEVLRMRLDHHRPKNHGVRAEIPGVRRLSRGRGAVLGDGRHAPGPEGPWDRSRRRGDHAFDDVGFHRESDRSCRRHAGLRRRGSGHADGVPPVRGSVPDGANAGDHPRPFCRGPGRHRADSSTGGRQKDSP